MHRYSSEFLDRAMGLNVSGSSRKEVSWEVNMDAELAEAHQSLRTSLFQMFNNPEMPSVVRSKMMKDRVNPALRVFEKKGAQDLVREMKKLLAIADVVDQTKIRTACTMLDDWRPQE